MRGITNATAMTANIPIGVTYATSTTPWASTDLNVVGTDGNPVFKIRFYQQNTSRNVQIGIADANGTFYWTGVANHST